MIGYTNSFRMVDGFLAGQTENATSIELVLDIGELFFGYSHFIGATLAGSGTRLKDYSVKEVNDWGEYVVTERAFSRGAELVVGLNPQENDRIQRILEVNRAKVCAFFPSENMEHYGLTVAGFFSNYEPSLEHRGVVPVTINIEGIT